MMRIDKDVEFLEEEYKKCKRRVEYWKRYKKVGDIEAKSEECDINIDYYTKRFADTYILWIMAKIQRGVRERWEYEDAD